MQCLTPQGTTLALLVQQGAEIAWQIGASTPGATCAKRSTNNAPPPQPNPARARSAGCDCLERSIEVSSRSHTRHLSKDGVSYRRNKRWQNQHKGKDHHSHDARNIIEENHQNVDLTRDHQSTCETQTRSRKQIISCKDRTRIGRDGCCVVRGTNCYLWCKANWWGNHSRPKPSLAMPLSRATFQSLSTSTDSSNQIISYRKWKPRQHKPGVGRDVLWGETKRSGVGGWGHGAIFASSPIMSGGGGRSRKSRHRDRERGPGGCEVVPPIITE
jgi:hypothetical protein